jgi:hypothetical protein
MFKVKWRVNKKEIKEKKLSRALRDKLDLEVYEGVSLMRNIIAGGAETRLTTDSLIEQLITLGGYLVPYYQKCLLLLRHSGEAKMIEFFVKNVPVDIAEDYIRLISSWDHIEPARLKSSLFSYQSSLKEKRFTMLKRRDEIISDIIFLPIVVNSLLIFMNFIIVGYFIEQKEMLNLLFFR